jgi:type III pantothenate kinase
MNLVIDIGNTRTKMASFTGHELSDQIAGQNSNRDNFLSYLESKGNDINCIISAVTVIPGWLTRQLKKNGINPLILDSSLPLPFKNKYQSRKSLGNDRIAAIAGACYLYPGRNVLIIDAGTALTFDVKTEKEEYLGGNISPGITMRFHALHDYTSKLPLLQGREITEIIGQNTMQAIQNGVQNGILFEVKSYIKLLSNKYTGLVVLLTGGDAHFFENKLKKTIFVVSNLTLIGLNIILQHNAKNN